jgi:pimeloyl-ACP methyl ester carboxylesterase
MFPADCGRGQVRRSAPTRLSLGASLAACLAMCLTMLAACDIPEPTATPSPTMAILAASPTINARPPSDLDLERTTVAIIGTRSAEYTPAAPSLVAGKTITPTPYPTEESFAMPFTMRDGIVIAATYRGAVNRPAPTLLLLPSLGGVKEDWDEFAGKMQALGFNSLAIDWRGQGETGGSVDWRKAQADVLDILGLVSSLPSVDSQRISVVGAGIGANLGLVACATLSKCRSLVLLSPANDYEGVLAQEAMAIYGPRPVLIVASRTDGTSAADSAGLDQLAKGDHRLLIYEGNAHGVALLRLEVNLMEIVTRWLAAS